MDLNADMIVDALPIVVGGFLLIGYGMACWRQRPYKAVATGVTAFLALVIGVGRWALG